jgi:hypothetical protein
MKVWQRVSLCLAVVLLAVWPAEGALAAVVSGHASTELDWYATGWGKTAVPAFEYLQLNVRDIGGQGWNFMGYGRLGTDLNNADQPRSNSRFYYGYLEKKNVVKNLDLKLGRQFITTTAGASIMDGLYLNYHNLGPLGIKLFGGGDVAYYNGYNAKNLIDGAQLYGHFFHRTLDLGVSYLQRWDHGDMANEMYGLTGNYQFHNSVDLYSSVQYDYLSNSVSYFDGGIVYHRSPKWSLRAQYIYSLPVFSATSIYSVFAVDEYREISGEFDYTLGLGVDAFLRYTHEIYQEIPDANVFEAGIEKIGMGHFSGYLSGVYRDDPGGQDLKGFKAHVGYLFNEKFHAGAGVQWNVLQRRLNTYEDPTFNSGDTMTTTMWLDSAVYFTKKTNFQLRVERDESVIAENSYAGEARLNIFF